MGITENNIDLASDYTPEESAAYQITSVGACQGIRKVIRKVHTLGDNAVPEAEKNRSSLQTPI